MYNVPRALLHILYPPKICEQEQLKETRLQLNSSNISSQRYAERVVQLENALADEQRLQAVARNELKGVKDTEQRRLQALVHIGIQTSPPVMEQSVQTDFYVPQVRLDHQTKRIYTVYV